LSRISPVGLSTSARLGRVLAGKMKERRPLAGLARDKSGLVLLLVWWMSANDSLLSQMSTNLLSNSAGKRVPRAVLPASYCSPATTVNDVRLLSSKPSEIRTSSQGLYKLLTENLELQYSARHCRWEIRTHWQAVRRRRRMKLGRIFRVEPRQAILAGFRNTVTVGEAVLDRIPQKEVRPSVLSFLAQEILGWFGSFGATQLRKSPRSHLAIDHRRSLHPNSITPEFQHR
jgi:hypothetical protein